EVPCGGGEHRGAGGAGARDRTRRGGGGEVPGGVRTRTRRPGAEGISVRGSLVMPTQQPGPLRWTPARVLAAVAEAGSAAVVGAVFELPWSATFPLMLACFLHGSLTGRVSPLV